jgi:hypothetical protein
MPDVKISALPAATVPLAGTEVLPIVQSATTRQVSVANLTAGRAISASSVTNAALTSGRVTYAGTAGLLQDSAALTFDGTSLTTPRLVLGGTTLPSAGTSTLFSRTSDNNTYLQTGSGNNVIFLDGSQNTLTTFAPTLFTFLISGAEKMRLNSTGLGIGTSSPSYTLDLSSTTSGIIARFKSTTTYGQVVADNSSSTGGGVFIAKQNGLAPSLFGIEGAILGTTSTDTAIFSDATGSSIKLYTNGSGTPKLTVASTGIVTMSAYGAGAATFDASGVISSVSDETWKTKDGVPTNPDVMLQKLEPGYWFYNDEKKETFSKDRQLGFYAQNVHKAIGAEAAPTPEEGKPWGYYDRSVLAIAVMSLKTALNTIEELKQRITALENK